jgi:hypothetical protein
VLSGDTEGWRRGWGVLVSRGMAAWITTQRQIPGQIPGQIPVAQHQNPGTHSAPSTPPPTGQAAELVRVLAGMALAQLRPEHDQGDDCEHRRRQRGGQGHPRAPAA